MLEGERRRSFLGYFRPVCLVFRKNTAGQFEVVQSLFAGHAGGACRDKLGLGWNVSGQLPLSIELSAAFGGRDSLHAARVREFLAIGHEPSFAVSRRVHARRRDANEHH
jgi:hypothetical protein